MYDILIRKIAHKASKRYSSSNCVICIDDYIISSSHLDWLYCTVLQFKSVNVSHIACHTFPLLLLLLLLPSFFYRSSNLPTISIREKIVDYRPLATEGNGKIIRFAQRIINFLNNACQIFTITTRSIFHFKRWETKKRKRKFRSKFFRLFSLFFSFTKKPNTE